MSSVETGRLRAIVKRWAGPSLLDVFFVALLLGAFVHPAGLRALLADGDTGWHIRTGELVLATGHAPAADPFSFSRAGEPWFAWEWLADAVFAGVWRWKGEAGVAALAGVVIALSITAMLARVLRRGCGLWVGLAAALAAASASSVHYLARPHVFSILFYTVALWALAEDRDRRTRTLWLLVPLTALWANLHAGFAGWLATLVLAVAVSAWERNWRRAQRWGLLAALCSLATLLNPYGWQLHLHVGQYLNSGWIMDHVQEFQSPQIRSEGMVVFAVLLLVAVWLAHRADRLDAVLLVFWAFAALRSARHIPFFAISAAPVVASALSEYWTRLADRVAVWNPVRVFRDLALDLGRPVRASLWLPLSAAVAVVGAPSVSFPETLFPVAAVEKNGETLAAGTPRILTSDQWADYLIFRLYPRQRVFFDGRSDFFGPSIGTDYRKLMAGDGGWRQLVDRYQFQMALLPHTWALNAALEREPGWRLVYEDSVAVLYARDRGSAP